MPDVVGEHDSGDKVVEDDRCYLNDDRGDIKDMYQGSLIISIMESIKLILNRIRYWYQELQKFYC